MTMEKKQDGKKSAKSEIPLTLEESNELEMIEDRLLAQDPDGQSLESYLKSLRKALAGREHLAVAVIEKLARTPSRVGFKTLNLLDDLAVDKKYRRIIKQARYRFSQKGFSAAEEAPVVETVVLIPKEVKKGAAHFAIPNTTFWVVTALIPESNFGRPVLISAFFENGFARLNVMIGEGSNRVYRELLQELGDEFSVKLSEIPLWHAAKLFFEMNDLVEVRSGSRELRDAKKIFQPYYEPERPSLAHELMPKLENPGAHLSEVNIPALLQSINPVWFLMPKSDISPWREKIQELENPVLVIPPEVQRERTVELLRHAGDQLCVGERRRLYRRFFEEYALWMKLSGNDDLAMSAWIVARHLGSEAAAGANPAVFQLILFSMSFYWPKDFEEKESQKEEPFHKTDSGLILV